MDSLITYDEVAEFLKNPPLLSPRPDFSKLRALRKYMSSNSCAPKARYTDGQAWSFPQWCTHFLSQPLFQYQEILARWQYMHSLPPPR